MANTSSSNTHQSDISPAAPTGSVTLADIAKATGFSLMTVSNALRDKPKVSEANRDKIKQVARQMGYQTNAAASALRAGRSGIIQLVVDDFEVPFHARIAKYLTQAATERDYQMVVRQSSSSEREEVQALNPGPGLIYDGIILDAPNITEQQVLHHGSGKPILVIGDCESFVNINSMDTACAQGAAAAAEHLWQNGCRRFFVLGAPHPGEQNSGQSGSGNGFGPRRLTAITQTLAKHGVTIEPNQCLDCERTLEGGREAAWRLLDREFQITPPTPECGILCLSDTIAIGALHELTEHDIRIPQDAKLMGFDGIPFSACANPAISTVEMDVPAMARTVIDRIINMIEAKTHHEPLENVTHDHIRFQVIPRSSTENL